MLSALITVIYHDIVMTLRQAFSWLTPLLFFIIVICLFPLALGQDSALLHKLAPGIIWIAALLSILISIGQLFRRDAEEGHVDLMLLSPHPLTVIVLSKIFSFWLLHCLPLILVSPILGIALGMTIREELILMGTLLLGTPVLCLLGSIGSALLVGIRGHGLLLPVLIMPLYVSALVFGTGAIIDAPYPVTVYFAMMGALLFTSLAFAPLLAGIALRTGVNQ